MYQLAAAGSVCDRHHQGTADFFVDNREYSYPSPITDQVTLADKQKQVADPLHSPLIKTAGTRNTTATAPGTHRIKDVPSPAPQSPASMTDDEAAVK